MVAMALASPAVAQDPASEPAPAPAPEPVPTPVDPTPVAPRSPIAPPNPSLSWAGRLLVVATARATPSPDGKPLRLLQPIAPLGAGPVWLQVRGVRVVDGVRWVKVLIPVRPNGSTGWVRASDFVFRPITLRVDIDLSERRLTLVRKGKRVRSWMVAVGTPTNPTPTGRFAIAEVIPTGDPKAFLGPLVLPITGFSNTLNEFAGGNGRVAIHGTSQPELIGRRVSHGCIRMRNADVQALARVVRAGTPVIIRN
jgi:lipoprotein-anchoring transpeptidase ErfK/SrfK